MSQAQPQVEPRAWTRQAGWIPAADLALPFHDLGLLQAVIAVDRLRTFGGKLSHASMADHHLERFSRSCQSLGIRIPVELPLTSIMMQVAERNAAAFDGDFSIVLMATPGSDPSSLDPTVWVYPVPIDWQKLDQWYQQGQKLIISRARNIPEQCWAPSIKTRARLQYYLADREAPGRHTQAILLDQHGFLTETATANVLLIEGNQLVSPRAERILPGVALARSGMLADRLGIELQEADIAPDRAKAADGILLCGTTGCLWPAASLDDSEWSAPSQGSLFKQLLEAWQQFAQLDFVAQARLQASTSTSSR